MKTFDKMQSGSNETHSHSATGGSLVDSDLLGRSFTIRRTLQPRGFDAVLSINAA
jgi:hypothetical protein